MPNGNDAGARITNGGTGKTIGGRPSTPGGIITEGKFLPGIWADHALIPELSFYQATTDYAKTSSPSASDVFALCLPNRSIAFEYFFLAFQSQRGADGASAESVGQHLPAAEQDELRVMLQRHGYVLNLHPSFGFPAHEFHFLGWQVFGADDCRGAVVFLEPLIHDQSLITEIFGHGRARVRGWMLNVGPVHIAAGEFEIRFDGLFCVAGTADD